MSEKQFVGCIIQARMGSSRFPGKVLKQVYDKKTVLDCVIEQLRFSHKIDLIIVAISDLEKDDILEKFLIENKISYFRGSESDVLDRYYQCAIKYSLSIVVRIPSDKPLIDPYFVDKIIEKFQENHFDYVTTFNPPTFPRGSEVEVFSIKSLIDVWKNAKLPSEREHVTPYFYTKNKFSIFNCSNHKNLSNIRYAVDRYEDLLLVKEIFSKIKKRPIEMNDILELLDSEPLLLKINENVDHNEGYEKSLKEDKSKNH